MAHNSNTIHDLDFDDRVTHHKSSRRVTPRKGANYRGFAGRKGRGVYPGAEYCPIDTPDAIARTASVQASMAAAAVAAYEEVDLYDPSGLDVVGLSISMIEFMNTPAYALGRWNLGYRDCDIDKVA